MDVRAAREQSTTYYETAIQLTKALLWPLIYLGFYILNKHRTDLDLPSARAAIAQLYGRVTSKWPEDNQEAINQQLALHTFTQEIGQRFGIDVFSVETTLKSLNTYFGHALTTDEEQVRNSANGCFRELLVLLKGEKLSDAIDTMMACVQKDMTVALAMSVHAELVAIADDIEQAKLIAYFEAITLSLRQANTDAQASFGADVLCQALAPDVASKVRAVVISLIAGLIGLVNSSSHAPANLVHLGRVFDRAVPYLEANLPQYLDQLNLYLTSTTSQQNINFAIDHIQAAAQQNVVPDSHQMTFCQSLIQQWTYIQEAGHLATAARLLITWKIAIPTNLLPTYQTLLLELLQQNSLLAWEGLKSQWATVAQAQRLQIVSTAISDDNLWQQLLQDISTKPLQLPSTDVTAILIDASTKVTEAKLASLQEALTITYSEVQKDEAANLIFEHVHAMPDHLPDQVLLQRASMMASAIVPGGLSYYVELLRSDVTHRTVAFETISTFVRGKQLNEPQTSELASALGGALTADRGDLLARNLELSRELGLLELPVYTEHMKELEVRLKQSSDNQDKIALRTLKTYLPRKRRNA